MKRNIKGIVNQLAEEHGTREPFRLAESMGILVRKGNLGTLAGCCIRLAGEMVIFINDMLDESLQRWVMAHELGHAVLHNEDWYFFLTARTMFTRAVRKKRQIHLQ